MFVWFYSLLNYSYFYCKFMVWQEKTAATRERFAVFQKLLVDHHYDFCTCAWFQGQHPLCNQDLSNYFSKIGPFSYFSHMLRTALVAFLQVRYFTARMMQGNSRKRKFLQLLTTVPFVSSIELLSSGTIQRIQHTHSLIASMLTRSMLS